MTALVDRCGHCGRQGTVDSKRHVVVHSRADVATIGARPHDTMDVEYQTVVEVAGCRVCGEVTVTQYNWVDPLFDDPDDALNVRVLFPSSHEVADLPERVGRRYGQLLEMLHAPDAFAVRAGKLLEAVCLEEGVPRESDGRRLDLYDRLEILVQDEKVPKLLVDQAHLVRRYRNIGGHDDELDAMDEDVPLIRGFVENLLDYLYWGPIKLDRGNAELKRRRQALRPN